MGVLEDLRSAGIDVRVEVDRGGHEFVDGRLELVVDERRVGFVVVRRGRAPYPNEVGYLDILRDRVAAIGLPLLVAPFITAAVGEALAGRGWSWADEHGNYSLTAAAGLRLRRRAVSEPSRPVRRVLPTGSGSGSIIRQLIYAWRGVPIPTVSALANLAGVSQPRASQVLAQLVLLGFVAKSDDGERRVVDREALLDRFLAEYRGPGGSERYLYSLDAPLVTARRAGAAARDGDVVVSADVGPDLVAPWRKPTVAVIYSRGGISDEALGAVRAESRDSANVIVRTPLDLSVFPAGRLVVVDVGVEIALADPVQMLWDLLDLGGAEREAAAGVLRDWIIGHP